MTEQDVRDEAEQCCKDVCDECNTGSVPERHWYGHGRVIWWHDNKDGFCHVCKAAPIRERRYQQEQAKPDRDNPCFRCPIGSAGGKYACAYCSDTSTTKKEH